MKVYIEPRDWWIGYYRGDDHHYVCPLPTVVIRWARRMSGCGGCVRCNPGWFGMYLCATCGNKRCPAASDCLRWECSGSNDTDQGPPTPRT